MEAEARAALAAEVAATGADPTDDESSPASTRLRARINQTMRLPALTLSVTPVM
jgi:hypothetical protein